MAIVTVCGSGENRELIHTICEKLEKKGYITLVPTFYNIKKYSESMDSEGEMLLWRGAVFANFNRVKTADVCIMINPAGYLGIESSLELGYAVSLGKLIIALQHDHEQLREALFDIVLECEDTDEIANKISTLLKK